MMDSRNTMEAQLFKDVFEGKHKSVQELCEKKRDVLDGVTPRGNSALHIAASRGHSEMVQVLLKLRPDLITKKNDKGETPLHKAAAAGDQKIVDLLLNNKCGDVESIGSASVCDTDGGSLCKLVNNDEETALHYAAIGGYLKIVEILLSKVKGIERVQNKDGETALHMACDRGLTKVAMRLLNENVSADDYYMRNDGRTWLHVAIVTELEDLALELLGKRRELAEKADPSGNMPLHLATSHGYLKVVREILKVAPQSIFCCNDEKMYPIHIAAKVGSVETIKLLIESAPHCMELLGERNKNAFNFALENDGNWEATVYLLRNAPDVDLFINDPDDQGNTALQMALKSVNIKFILWVLAWNMNAVKTRIRGAIFKEHVEREKRKRNSQGADIVSENERISLESSQGDGIGNQEGNGLTNDSTQTLSIVATLLATVTFAALFTIPGGVTSDHGIPVRMHAAALKAFIIADTLAMCFSMLALMVLLDAHFVYLALVELNFFFGFQPLGDSSKIFLQKRGFLIGRTSVFCAFVATMISYATGLYVLVAPRCLWLAVLAFLMVFGVIFILFILQIRSVLKLWYSSIWGMVILLLADRLYMGRNH